MGQFIFNFFYAIWLIIGWLHLVAAICILQVVLAICGLPNFLF